MTVLSEGITLPPLRDPISVRAIDPMSVAPNPGAMGQLYIDMRTYHPDGMSLACAEPKPQYTYDEIVTEYIERRSELSFSDKEFWDSHFDMTDPDDQLFVAAPGTDLDTYLQELRPNFLHENKETSSFDIWLPYRRSVAGAGRFSRHSFLWDGYQMAKGYEADDRWDLILDIADNYEYQINKYGYVLNGSAEFYATRTQPAYFSNLVSMIAEKYGPEALVRYLPAMEKEYEGYWMDGKGELEQLPDDGETHEHRSLVRVPLGDGKFAFLNRYWDDADGPRLESYKEDVDLGELVTNGLSGVIKQRRLQKLFKDLRAGAASGWDYSSRWLADGQNMETINTTDILPVDLNSLLARTEQVLAQAHLAAGNPDKAMEYLGKAEARTRSVNSLMWDGQTRIYRDYNYAQMQKTEIVSGAMSYPLYCGIANMDQALGVADAIESNLLFEGGVIATTTADSTQQWDGGKRMPDGTIKGNMNVWAPVNWATARGLARTAFMLSREENQDDPWVKMLRQLRKREQVPKEIGKAAVERLIGLSERVRTNYMHGIETVYETRNMVTEKHRGDDPAIPAGGGEYQLVKVLAMPGETYRAFQVWSPRDPEGCLPIGRCALAA